MAGLRFWSRLEPRVQDDDLRRSQAAQVGDPLWFLARQWQLGEFLGEDGGSPAAVEIGASTLDLSEWHTTPPGAVEVRGAIDPRMALDAQALGEPPDLDDLPSRVELGLWFLEALAAEDLGEGVANRYRAIYPIDPIASTEDERAFASFIDARSVDGVRLFRDIRRDPLGIAPGVVLETGTSMEAQRAQQAFCARVRRVFGDVGPRAPAAWRTEQLGFELGVRAAGSPDAPDLSVKLSLGAPLDWYSLDVASPASSRGLLPGTWRSTSASFLPMHVRFKGMPNERFWDMESGAMDPGAIEGDRRDLARLLFMDALQVAGNDWFLVPLELPVGVLARVDQVVVRDVFGIRTTLHSARRDTPEGEVPWQMFTVSGRTEGDTFEVLPVLPLAVGAPMARPVERIRFLRDELVNVGWAVEVLLPDRLGQPRQCLYDPPTTAAPTSSPAEGAEPDVRLGYRLQTAAPKYWIPLIPRPDVSSGWIGKWLVLGGIRDPEGYIESVSPSSRLLGPAVEGREARIELGKVPRTGRTLERVWMRGLASDGRAVLWLERSINAGQGEGTSGLEFDGAVVRGQR